MAPTKKKRVLLVDTSRVKRDLRSETMRKFGMEVDCAADIAEARSWWRVGLYDLVLIHVEDGSSLVEKFCDDLRGATPPQQIMFLVGGPEFLATSPARRCNPCTGRRRQAKPETPAILPVRNGGKPGALGFAGSLPPDFRHSLGVRSSHPRDA